MKIANGLANLDETDHDCLLIRLEFKGTILKKSSKSKR